MKIDFNRIISLKNIRIDKSKLSSNERLLSRPLLHDKNLIEGIYRDFIEILTPDCMGNIQSVINRKKFIFVILYMFSPSSLAGGKMKNGIRTEISKVLGLKSKSTISDNCSDLIFLYQNYGKFREDVDSIYNEITKKLNEKGINLPESETYDHS